MATLTRVRDNHGRFTLGDGGGPGRPRRQTEANYLLALMEACPLDTWREVVQAAVVAAKDGDAKAREWLAKYLIGEPKHQTPTPTAVIVQQLIGRDEAVEKAAAILAGPDLSALLCGGDIEAARAEILAAERNATPNATQHR